MSRHIAHRLLISAPVLLGVLLIGFLLLQVVPTDPATVLAGPTATPAEVQALRESMGLDKPVWLQFVLYLARVLQFDLGRSMISNTPVIEEIGNTIGPTIELMLASLVWAVPLGILLGTLAAVRRGQLLDRLIMALSVAGVSMPIFWFGLILIQYVGTVLELLPFQGRGGPLWSIDGLRHIALPAITLGGVFVGPVARMTRTALLDVLGADYVRTARAKGVAEGSVVMHHALRNALIPIVTLVGLQIGFLLGGAVVTETMFAWPGVGRMAVGAITSADFPLAQGAWGKLATQEFDAFGMSFPYVSAGDALNLYFRSANTPTPNRMNWKDPETDELLKAGSAALSEKVRYENYAKVQEKVADAAVWIPLYHEPLYAIVGANLKPVKAHGNYGCAFYKGLGLEFK